MARFGLILIYGGIMLIAAGMLVGFPMLFVDSQHPLTRLIGVIPYGFVAALLGMVVRFLHGSGQSRQ